MKRLMLFPQMCLEKKVKEIVSKNFLDCILNNVNVLSIGEAYVFGEEL